MAGSNGTTAPPGTADRSSGGSTSTDDQVLSSALAEMATEGFQADAPVGTDFATTETGQDEPAGHTPAGDAPPAREATASPPSPGTPGQSPASPTDATAQPSPEPTDEEAFAQAAPLTFMVDGKPQTFDAIKVFPGEGALIREADLPRLQTELANATHYLAQSRELVRQLQDVERVSEWTQKGPDGRDTILTGAAAIQAQRLSHADTLAELTTLKQALSDPATLTALIAGVDENGYVVLNQRELANLGKDARILSTDLRTALASRFTSATVSPQAQQSAPDLSTQAPAVVNAYAAKLGVQGLTPEDVSTLAALVPRYVRAATQADRQLDPSLKVGEPVVDISFEAQVKHLGKVRSDALASQTKAVATGETAGKHNAAMNRARQPVKQVTKPVPTPATPEKKPGKAEAWDTVLQNALQEINV